MQTDNSGKKESYPFPQLSTYKSLTVVFYSFLLPEPKTELT